MSNQDGAAPAPAEHQPEYHNSVLTRTHEPPRSGNHSWLYVIPLVLVIVVGGAFWVWERGHPPPPLVNHAVAAAPHSYLPSS